MSVTSIRSDAFLVATPVQKPTCPNMYLHLRYKSYVPHVSQLEGQVRNKNTCFLLRIFTALRS